MSESAERPALRCAGRSHPGLERDDNEDRFHGDPARGIFIVVDGVGGQAAGGEAADIALGRLRARLERFTGTAAQRVREAVALANNEVYRLAQARDEWRGMACVLTVAVVEGGLVTAGHVGDTRLYKLRGGRLVKLSHDHSPVGEREDAGELSELSAMRHPRRNEVYRGVGTEPHGPDDEDFVELIETPFEADSALLLCSDGLSDMVTSAQIQSIVEQHARDPDKVVDSLIEAANCAGGRDNITALFVAGESYAWGGAAPDADETGMKPARRGAILRRLSPFGNRRVTLAREVPLGATISVGA